MKRRRDLIRGIGAGTFGIGVPALGTTRNRAAASGTQSISCYEEYDSYSPESYTHEQSDFEEDLDSYCESGLPSGNGIDGSGTLMYLFTAWQGGYSGNWHHFFRSAGHAQHYQSPTNPDCPNPEWYSYPGIEYHSWRVNEEEPHNNLDMRTGLSTGQGAYPGVGSEGTGQNDINEAGYTPIDMALSYFIGKIGGPLAGSVAGEVLNQFEYKSSQIWDEGFEWDYNGAVSCADHFNVFEVYDPIHEPHEEDQLSVDILVESLFDAVHVNIILDHQMMLDDGDMQLGSPSESSLSKRGDNNEDIWEESENEEYDVGDVIEMGEKRFEITGKSVSPTKVKEGKGELDPENWNVELDQGEQLYQLDCYSRSITYTADRL